MKFIRTDSLLPQRKKRIYFTFTQFVVILTRVHAINVILLPPTTTTTDKIRLFSSIHAYQITIQSHLSCLKFQWKCKIHSIQIEVDNGVREHINSLKWKNKTSMRLLKRIYESRHKIHRKKKKTFPRKRMWFSMVSCGVRCRENLLFTYDNLICVTSHVMD